MKKIDVRKLLSENYPILSILIGIMLVSLSIGPYQNGDTHGNIRLQLGVIKWGMPYLSGWGNNIINQPPVGFYVEALFFKIFGSSINTGVILVTLFGLGSTVLVYKIGKELYGKSTGLFAAVLFALTPWELVLSRSFLIDAQCLFLSLLCLFIGIIAIRKGSFKLFMVTGALFAAAFLTKFFAVFILIPLLLFYVYYQPKNLKAYIWLVWSFFLTCSTIFFLLVPSNFRARDAFIFNQSDLVNRNSSVAFLRSFLFTIFL